MLENTNITLMEIAITEVRKPSTFFHCKNCKFAILASSHVRHEVKLTERDAEGPNSSTVSFGLLQ